MSISSQVNRLKNEIASAFTACKNKGATIPTIETIENLPSCISSIPTGVFPTGNLTDSLIVRSSYFDSSGNGAHKATIPVGYYVNSAITISEWKSGIINGSGSSGGVFTVPYSSIGFIPVYAVLIPLEVNNSSVANTVLAVYGNGASAYSAVYVYTGSKATLSASYPINTTYNTITINSNGITFVGLSGVKYGTFSYRWFALR